MKTVFIRATEASIDQKQFVLCDAANGHVSNRFEATANSFSRVPGSPFAYWTHEFLREIFTRFDGLNDGAFRAVSTNPLNDDPRYARCWWEVDPARLNNTWIDWAKGGSFSPIYYDIHTVISWSSSRQSYSSFIGTANRPLTRPASSQYFFRPGLYWPRRTLGGLSIRIMPRGCIFGDKGPAMFSESNCMETLLAMVAVSNSIVFKALVDVQMAE